MRRSTDVVPSPVFSGGPCSQTPLLADDICCDRLAVNSSHVVASPADWTTDPVSDNSVVKEDEDSVVVSVDDGVLIVLIAGDVDGTVDLAVKIPMVLIIDNIGLTGITAAD